MSIGRYRALTVKYNEITNQVRTKIRVFNGMTIQYEDWSSHLEESKEYTAIWDTGATNSAITQRVVDDLGLSVVLRGITHTAAGSKETTAHNVHLLLPNNVVIKHCCGKNL
jgi:hypothetical protein